MVVRILVGVAWPWVYFKSFKKFVCFIQKWFSKSYNTSRLRLPVLLWWLFEILLYFGCIFWAQISKEISIPVLKYRYLYRSTSPVSELVPVLVLAPRTGVLVLNLVPVSYRCHLELCERLSIFVKTNQENRHSSKKSKKKKKAIFCR